MKTKERVIGNLTDVKNPSKRKEMNESRLLHNKKEAPHHPLDNTRKGRTSSFFSMKDHETLVNERKQNMSRRGAGELIHFDKPLNDLGGNSSDIGSFMDGDKGATHTKRQRTFSNISSVQAKSTIIHNGNYQNTYELQPANPFNTKQVRQLIQTELNQILYDKNGDQIPSKHQCTRTAEMIKNKLKALSFDRYRYIVTITSSSNVKQTIKVASRFFWDAERDKYVCEVLENKHFYLVCVVYAVYFE